MSSEELKEIREKQRSFAIKWGVWIVFGIFMLNVALSVFCCVPVMILLGITGCCAFILLSFAVYQRQVAKVRRSDWDKHLTPKKISVSSLYRTHTRPRVKNQSPLEPDFEKTTAEKESFAPKSPEFKKLEYRQATPFKPRAPASKDKTPERKKNRSEAPVSLKAEKAKYILHELGVPMPSSSSSFHKPSLGTIYNRSQHSGKFRQRENVRHGPLYDTIVQSLYERARGDEIELDESPKSNRNQMTPPRASDQPVVAENPSSPAEFRLNLVSQQKLSYSSDQNQNDSNQPVESSDATTPLEFTYRRQIPAYRSYHVSFIVYSNVMLTMLQIRKRSAGSPSPSVLKKLAIEHEEERQKKIQKILKPSS